MIEPSLTAPRRLRSLRGSGLAGPLVALVFAVAVPLPASAPARPVIDAASSSSERTISFYNLHTKETLTVTYKKNGRYDSAGLDKINHMLRDWRRDESTSMDPKLIDLIYEIHHELGSTEPIGIVSGYRSPTTNAALRRRSNGVAKHSQHTLGKAMDVYFPDVPLSRLRETALLHEEGGVGYYPTSGRPFVHIDVGPVRYWPRMPREQLARLFPDGKTAYIPADGRPLARKVRTQDVQIARADSVVVTPPTPTERPGPADRDVPPDRPVIIPRAAPADRSIEVARADPSAPTRGAGGEADSGSRGSFISSLFGFKAIEQPDAARGRPQDAVVAGLQPPSVLLPEGSSAPVPTPRPEIELAASSEEEPSATASLTEPEPAAGGDQSPLTIASLLERESADGGEDEPLTTASLPQPRPTDGSEDKPLNPASLWERGPELAVGDRQPVTVASRWQLEPEIAGGNEDEPLTTASLPRRSEPADKSEQEPVNLASLWEQGPEPAAGDRQPVTVPSRLQLKPRPADSGKNKPLTTASLPLPPAPAKIEERSVGQPMVLASLAPAPRAPAAQHAVFRRDAPGIWSGGMSYQPPAVGTLVAHWRLHGEAFAAFTAPDQTHLASLMRAPEQSLSIRFARGPVQTPYAEAFVGAAVAPLPVADLAPPLVTAAR